MLDTSEVVATPCPLCGAREDTPVRAFDPFRVVRCGSCGLLFLNPRLHEDLMRAAYANEAYFEGGGLGYSGYEAQERTLRRTFARFLSTLQSEGMTGGRLLELGCAYGYFLDEARGYFEERVGTDFSERAVARAVELADRVYLGGLDALPEGEAFDCVVMVHVIEHIYDPVGLLRSLTSRLRPGGAVVLATPDGGSFWRRLMGRRWPFYKPPEHVSFFDRRTLPRLLEAAGLQPVVLPYPSFFPLHLIGEKLGIGVPGWARELTVPLPATTVAAAGCRPEDSGFSSRPKDAH